jgi:oligopeptide/dipeptide ABC transporter ATP-binding protein
MALLEARDLQVAYRPAGSTRVWSVRDVSFSIEEGEFVGLVGESGCGKSTLGFALTHMLRPPAVLESGSILFKGVELATMSDAQVREQRRNGIALVLQAGMNALSPVRSIEHHFRDVLAAHAHAGEKHSKEAIRSRSAELLAKVQLDEAVLRRFPHELSGGMRQRVAIALALALEPRMIVFDEPTTALDVVVQAAVMRTIKQLQAEQGFSALLISHDLGVVLDATDRVLVMYAGEIVEDQPARQLLNGSHHPYTEALLDCYADPRAEQIQLGGIPGSPPDLSLAEAGCPFTPRCPLAVGVCSSIDPPLTPHGHGLVACHVRAPSTDSKEVAGV